MKLKGVKKVASGKYLNFYNLFYENRMGHAKTYEIISRNGNLTPETVAPDRKPQAVLLIVFDRNRENVLINKEFRMAVNSYIYNMPAGLIEKGESVEEAAKRELKEETGLDLIEVLDVLPATYSSVGISNEMTRSVICVADGVLGGEPEEDEEIEAFWVSKEMASEMLSDMNFEKHYPMAARTQMLLYMWLNNKF